ncbi:MAG TPA: tetratricopeptide repeat protein [Burkholderiales bacterium]|nr:tetratricopeptide repeat protein [Burkholderiales bacterium]
MSLLLEALKKAERNKPDAAPGAGARSELSLMDEDLPRAAAAAEEDAAADPAAAERQAADQLFSAKNTGRPRRAIAAAAVAALVLAAAGGAYVWYQTLGSKGSLQVASGPRTPATVPAPPSAPAAPPMAAPAAPPAATAPAPPAVAAAPALESTPAVPAREAGRVAPRRERAVPRQPASEEAAPERVRVQRTQSPPQVEPNVAAGYQALSQGNLEAAQQDYARAVKADPASKDALLGLAATEMKRGNAGEAQRLYHRVLELDPRDPLAISALLALRPQTDPILAESRLKTLIGQHPDSAVLYFTLGNVYAGRVRWAEAQQAYFRAFSLDAGNADYAFNLAVSLDQLSQRRLAADYYGKALALASAGGAGFDRVQAERRLRELQAD